MFKDNVKVTFWCCSDTSAWPVNSDIPKSLELSSQRLLSNIPSNTTKKYFARQLGGTETVPFSFEQNAKYQFLSHNKSPR